MHQEDGRLWLVAKLFLDLARDAVEVQNVVVLRSDCIVLACEVVLLADFGHRFKFIACECRLEKDKMKC